MNLETKLTYSPDNPVSNHLRSSFWYSVNDSVRDFVWDVVNCSVMDSIETKLKEYELK